jgi:nucleoside-diphosphate-sugar epimerase
VGSHLCDRLLAEDHEVISIDKLKVGDKENIAHLLERRDYAFASSNTYGLRMRLNEGGALLNLMSQAIRGGALTMQGDGLQTHSFCCLRTSWKGSSLRSWPLPNTVPGLVPLSFFALIPIKESFILVTTLLD